MVSGFMHNLMARHQDSSAELGAAQFVQPRHRARFETDPVPTIFSDRSIHVSEFGSVTHDEAAPPAVVPPRQRISSPPALNSVPLVSSSPIESLHQQPVLTERDSVQLNPKPQVIASRNTGTEAPVSAWGCRIEEMLYRLRTPQQQRPLGKHAPQIQAAQPHIQLVEQRAQHLGSNTANFDLGIEKILHRLNMQQATAYPLPAGKDTQSHLEQHKFTNDSAKKRTEQPQMRIIERQIEQQASLGAGTVSGRIEEILQRLTAKSNESSMMPSNQSAFSERIAVIEQTQAPLPHSAAGLLELPGWLKELQADLQNRWREASPQAQPEPVINVTIGRVEVRAMQAKAENRPKARPQPSGVMSLDEYLKQRDSRG